MINFLINQNKDYVQIIKIQNTCLYNDDNLHRDQNENPSQSFLNKVMFRLYFYWSILKTWWPPPNDSCNIVKPNLISGRGLKVQKVPPLFHGGRNNLPAQKKTIITRKEAFTRETSIGQIKKAIETRNLLLMARVTWPQRTPPHTHKLEVVLWKISFSSLSFLGTKSHLIHAVAIASID